MIGLFTDPFPDELLYSAVSRFHRRVRNGSKEATARDLFGHARTKIIVDFQTRLDYLASQLPPSTYPVFRLINDYTMLPFYAPFMPAERHEDLWHEMRGEGGGSIHAKLGVLTSGLEVKWLRLCPACAEDEHRAPRREPYWHRVHQTPGIEVCPQHAVFLINSAIKIRNRGKNEAFVTARQVTAELPLERRTPVLLDAANREHQILLRLAQRAEWLLKAQIRVSNLDALRSRYLNNLFEKGVAGYNGKVRHPILEEQFLSYYTPALLNRLNCGLKLRYHWLRRLINDWDRTRHPFHHLLLMEFLGRPMEEFFQGPLEFNPFGKGPWPCLNKAAGHYMEPCIIQCQVRDTWNEENRLIGTFRCDCGFAYRRSGADSTEKRRFHYDGILSFGKAWYEKLRSLLSSGGHTRKELAQVLGVGVYTVDKEVQRLKETGGSESYKVRGHRPDPVLSTEERLESYRSRWRKIVSENPELSRTALARNDYDAYNWLLKHDKDWFHKNSPVRQGSTGTRPRVNWQERDEKYSADARKTAEAILNRPGRPIRASRTGIASELGILAVVYKQASKLPLTNKALDEVSESMAAYAARRIRWAADCFSERRIGASQRKLAIRAAVSPKMALSPEVRQAMAECARALRELSERGWN